MEKMRIQLKEDDLHVARPDYSRPQDQDFPNPTVKSDICGQSQEDANTFANGTSLRDFFLLSSCPYFSVCPYVFLVFLSVCLSVFLSFCWFICLFCLSVFLQPSISSYCAFTTAIQQ